MGVDKKGLLESAQFSEAVDDFHRARAWARLQGITGRLRGKPVDLLSYEEVARRLQVTGKAAAGRAAIPLSAIVGSVGRYNDFTRTFLPRHSWDAQRWASVHVAGESGKWPPIDVYQIGDAYFVLDGNHRVSIARRQGLTHIEAVITVVHTRVPLSPNDDPDTLIVKTEHAAFLAATRLDKLRPRADVRVSVAGQYARLENLIEANRYLLEEAEQRVIDDREAVIRWYDERYLPVIKAIRQQGILRDFPNRTEADLYVFIAVHQAQLRQQFGWRVTPQVAAANLRERGDVAPRPWPARLRAWLGALLRRSPLRAQSTMAPPGSWSGDRVFARYNGQLFADILVALDPQAAGDQVLAQALFFARREQARIFGLCNPAASRRDAAEWTAAFLEQCRAVGIEGQMACEERPLVDALCGRALLADIVVASPAAVAHEGGIETLLRRTPRPLLLTSGPARPIRRALLYYDGSEKSREALFAAAYIAEQWQVELVTLLPTAGEQLRATVRDYLEFHDLPAAFDTAEEGWRTLAAAAERHDCDLLLVGCPGRRLRDRRQMAAFWRFLRACDRPLFVCP